MNWVEVTWIMMSAASLTLGFIHLFVWLKQRSQHAHLLFFVLAISAAAFAAFEMAMMRAESPCQLRRHAALGSRAACHGRVIDCLVRVLLL
jgi:two-component system sensor kinase FixL